MVTNLLDGRQCALEEIVYKGKTRDFSSLELANARSLKLFLIWPVSVCVDLE